MTSRSAEPISSTRRVWSSQDVIAQFVGAFFVELVALHGGEHGAEDFGAEDVGEGIGMFLGVLGQPEEQFAAGLVLADEAGQQFLQALPFAAGDQGVGHFPGQLGRDVIEGAEEGVGPVFRQRFLERFQGVAVFAGGDQFQDGADAGGFLHPDGQGGDLAFAGRQLHGGADFIADKNGLQRDGGLGALMGGNFGVQGGNNFAGGGGFVVQIGQVAEDVMGDVQAGL